MSKVSLNYYCANEIVFQNPKVSLIFQLTSTVLSSPLMHLHWFYLLLLLSLSVCFRWPPPSRYLWTIWGKDAFIEHFVVDLSALCDLGVLYGFLIFIDNELRNGLFQNCHLDPQNSFETAHSAIHCQGKTVVEWAVLELSFGSRE